MRMQEISDGVVLAVRVTPKAQQTRVLGIREDTLCVAVNVPPEKGKANQALLRFLGKRLHLPRTSLSLVRGETSRQKRVKILGVDAETVRERLSPS